MRKAAAVLLGLFSFAPLFWLVATAWRDQLLLFPIDAWVMNSAIGLVAIAMLSCIKLVPHGKRGLWAVVLFLGNFFALPFYWAWYVRPYLWSSNADATAV